MTKITTKEIKDIIRKEDDFGKVYGIPRGGWYIAQLIEFLCLGTVVNTPEEADCLVDDILDSGITRDKWLKKFPNKRFYTPFNSADYDGWLVFPWEESKKKDSEDLIVRILEHVGENPKREGLVGTPDRVVRSWDELYSGYKQDPKTYLKAIFESDCDNMVICKDIEYYSTCEHHMIPFYGKIHIGYLPNGHVIGLSKLARIADVFARRLQIQEQLTTQIAETIMEGIPDCLGVGVVVTGKHLCMCARGVQKQNSIMKTSALLGRFRNKEVRSEFFTLIGND